MNKDDNHWALLGGTFDPIHIGHLRTAISLLEVGFDKVQIIPNAQPPHKHHTTANAQQRLNMLELAIQSLPNLQANPIEIEQNQSSYSVETLKILRKNPTTAQRLTWVLGIDAWLDLPNWHQADRIIELANILVINRLHPNKDISLWHKQKLAAHESDLAQLLTSPSSTIAFLNLPQLEVSSSQIRNKLKQNHCIRYLVPDKVLDFIQQQELYKN